MIIGIAACDENGVIGHQGRLPWHLPEELQHFADTTRGFPIVMGYSTFLSLPPKYLDHRTTIIFSRTHTSDHPNQIFVHSLAEFNRIKDKFPTLYVIGGAQIFTLFLQENLIDEFILTKIHGKHAGDTFFPLAHLNGWPKKLIRQTPLFDIDRYLNPQRLPHASHNT